MQYDHQHDPKHEPVLYFKLISSFLPKLRQKIEKEKKLKEESRDANFIAIKAEVIASLEEIEDTIYQIVDSDRESVGAKIQRERKELQNSLDEIRTENERLQAVWDGFDPEDPQYPLELDLALQAWRAATKSPDIQSSPKEFIKQWLASNDQGLTNEQRERIAKVSNWRKQGGRPRSCPK